MSLYYSEYIIISESHSLLLVIRCNGITILSPWDNNTFRKWKYFVTNLCLSAVQEALKVTDYGKSMKYLFQPDNKDETKTELHNTKNNVQGLLLYHPILIDSPWQEPNDIDAKIGRLLQTTEPLLMARAEKEVL